MRKTNKKGGKKKEGNPFLFFLSFVLFCVFISHHDLLMFNFFNNFARSAKWKILRNNYTYFSNILKIIRLKWKFIRFCNIVGFWVKFLINECLKVQVKTSIKKCFNFINLINYSNKKMLPFCKSFYFYD